MYGFLRSAPVGPIRITGGNGASLERVVFLEVFIDFFEERWEIRGGVGKRAGGPLHHEDGELQGFRGLEFFLEAAFCS